MIPTTATTTDDDFTLTEQVSKTYKLNGNSYGGLIDELDAVEQSIYFMLNTERFEHPIFSWKYGVETNNLFGKQNDYVVATLKTNIIDCLTSDSRITSVENFNYTNVRGNLTFTFEVKTIFGTVNVTKGVKI